MRSKLNARKNGGMSQNTLDVMTLTTVHNDSNGELRRTGVRLSGRKLSSAQLENR